MCRASVGFLKKMPEPHPGVKLLKGFLICLNLVVDVILEMSVEFLWLLLFHLHHVLSHMTTEDVLAHSIRIILLGVRVVTHEPLLVVWDVQPTIQGTLQCHSKSPPADIRPKDSCYVDLARKWRKRLWQATHHCRT